MYEKTYKAVSRKNGDLATEVQARQHLIQIDEPLEQGGQDTGMNPIELLLSSVAACETLTIALYAQQLGIELEDLQVEVEGDLDSAGMMGIGGFRSGLTQIRTNVKIKSNAKKSDLDMLITVMEARCPARDSVGNGVEFAKPILTIE